jgi:hypothetical protein
MTIYSEKYGFVYIWYDRKYKRYYIGSHWGFEDDGYICSSRIMRQSYNRRPEDFKRRIIKRIYTTHKDLLIEENRWLLMIDPEKTTSKNTTSKARKNNVRYYNVRLSTQDYWWSDTDQRLTIGEKISAAKKGKPCTMTPEQLEKRGKKVSEAKKGKLLTEEHKKALRGIKKPAHTEEWKKQNSERFKAIWADPEYKAKMSEKRKAFWAAKRAS